MAVAERKWTRYLADYALGDGERDSIEVCGQETGVEAKEEILRAAERRKAAEGSKGIAQFLAELIDLGFEHRLQQLYRRFEGGEISLGFFAQEVGLGIRDLYAALERRGLPTTNIGAPQPTTGE
jgi:hypothetical protein